MWRLHIPPKSLRQASARPSAVGAVQPVARMLMRMRTRACTPTHTHAHVLTCAHTLTYTHVRACAHIHTAAGPANVGNHL